MKYFVPCILAACVTNAFSLCTSEKAFSSPDRAQQMDTTSNESDQASPYAKGLTAGRAKSLVGGVLALMSLIIGWRARTFVASSRSARSWATVALVLGLVAIGLSVVHLANVTGGFGTGGGKAGAIVAFVLGLTGTTLNGLTLRRKENSKT